MATDGTSFEIDIPVSGAAAASAADAVRLLGDRLEQTKASATAAADAVKAAESAYKASEVAADRAAKSHEKISLAVDAQKAKIAAIVAEHGEFSAAAQRAGDKLAQLVARQSEAAAKSSAASAALVQEAGALDKLKSAADHANATQANLTKSLDQTKKSAAHVADIDAAAKGSGNLGKLSGALNQLGGPLGSISGKATGAADAVADLTETVGAAGPYVAAAVVVIALATAMVTATVAATAWAISMAGAARSQMLLSDGIAGSVAGGRELDSAIKSLEKRVPQTSDELRSMAADLAKTGLKGKELTAALEDSATKAAKLKWGPDFGKGVNTTDKIVARLKANVTSLFAGPQIQAALGKFLDKLALLADLFDENSVTGKAMKTVVEDIFGKLIDGATAIIPKIISGFIQLQIWILKALITIKPYGSEIMAVVEALGIFVAVVVGVFIGAIALATAVLVAFIALPRLLGEAFTWAGTKLSEFGAYVSNFFSSIDFASLGSSIIQGLLSGIVGGGPALISGLSGVVSGAIDAAKKVLGIASPSKVFAEIGANTAEGMTAGVDAGAGDVQGSMVSMVSPPDAATAPTANASGGGGGTYYVTIQAAPGSTVDAYMQLVRETLTELVEGDVTQLAGAVPVKA